MFRRAALILISTFALFFLHPQRSLGQDNQITSYVCYNTGPIYAQVNSCAMKETTSVGSIATDILGACEAGQHPTTSQYARDNCENVYTINTGAGSGIKFSRDSCGDTSLLGYVWAMSGIQNAEDAIISSESSDQDCDYDKDSSVPGIYFQTPC